jgi:type II secretory pathway component PulM
MAYDPRQLLSYYNRLAPRERVLVGVAVLSVVVISLYSFVWDPLQTNRELLLRHIATKERDLSEIQRERGMYLELKRRLEANQTATSEGDPNFNLFAYLQSAISQAVSKEHITSMNPSNKNIGSEYQELMVEIKLQQISLPQIVDLVYRVEKGEHPLRFSRLQIKKRTNDIWNFDVAATVSLLKAVGAS